MCSSDLKKKKSEEVVASEEANTNEADASQNGEEVVMAENTENQEVETAEATETAGAELKVSAEDMALLNRYRTAGEDLIKELGNIEIRKARMIASYGQLEQASQQKLMQVGADLGIAEGTGWSVNPDGSITINTVAETTDDSE